MSNTMFWIGLSGILLILEMLTGTFYLLMLAIGTALGAMVAWGGLGFTGQLMVVTLCSGLATAAWHRWGASRRHASAIEQSSHWLDQGQTAKVIDWQPDGTPNVHYRGTQWQTQWQTTPPPPPTPDLHHVIIVGMEGNRLVVTLPD